MERKLKYWDKNLEYFPDLPRDEFQALKQDIEENGIINALHILNDGTVICGNQRLKAHRELGLPDRKIPTKVIDLVDERQIIMYAIKENLLRRQLKPEQKARPAAIYYKLKEELSRERHGKHGKEVDKLSTSFGIKSRDIVAKDLGLSGRSLDRLIQYNKVVESHPHFKDKPLTVVLKKASKEKEMAERKKAIINFKLKTLFEGKAEDNLRHIKDNTVDACIIDPPYNINFVSYSGRGTNDFSDNIDMDAFEEIVAEISRVLKPNSHFYCFTGFQTYHEFMAVIKKHFDVRNTLIWVKNNFTPTDFRYNYAHQYEMIIFASKGKRNLNNVNVKAYNGIPLNEVAKDAMGKSSDVFMFKNLVNKKHSAEKPQDLLRYLIANSTIKGEVVLDCFAGSGSTLLAAIKEGRNYFGIEKEKEFCDLIKKRIKEVQDESKI